MMNTEFNDYLNKSFLVLLHEAYDFGDWFWFPEMTSDELIVWWNAQDNFEDFLRNPGCLPGVLFNATDIDEENHFLKLRLSGEYFKADIEGPLDARLQAPEIDYCESINVAA